MANLNTSIENNDNLTSDAFFIPASEQTPKFEPREVVMPKPVETTPIMNTNMSSNIGSTLTVVVEPTSVPQMNVAPVEVTNGVTTVVEPQQAPASNISVMPNVVMTPAQEMQNINVIPNVSAPVPPAAPINQANINSQVMPNTNVVGNNIQPAPVGTEALSVGNQNLINNSIPIQNIVQATPNVENNNVSSGATFVMGVPANQSQVQNDNWEL